MSVGLLVVYGVQVGLAKSPLSGQGADQSRLIGEETDWQHCGGYCDSAVLDNRTACGRSVTSSPGPLPAGGTGQVY